MCSLFCFFQKNGDCQRHEPPTLSLTRKNLFTPLLHSTITNCSVLRRKEMLHDWSSYQAYITHNPPNLFSDWSNSDVSLSNHQA